MISSAHRFGKTPNETDRKLDFRTYHGIVEDAQRGRDEFDPQDFEVTDEGMGPRMIRSRFTVSTLTASFDYEVTAANTITIKTGYVSQRGEFQKVAEEDVTVGGGTDADPFFVYVRWPPTKIDAAEIAPNAVATYPTTSQQYQVRALYAVKLNGTTVVPIQDLRTDQHSDART